MQWTQLFHCLDGYVHIRAEGIFLERFLNICMRRDLDIRNVKRCGAERLTAESRRFEDLFRQEHGSLLCRDILGIDISSLEGMARACAQGVFSTVCAPLVARTCALLESGWDRS